MLDRDTSPSDSKDTIIKRKESYLHTKNQQKTERIKRKDFYYQKRTGQKKS